MKLYTTTFVYAVMILMTLSAPADAQQPLIPKGDHHTHIWSFQASSLVTQPLMPVIEVPADLRQLLDDKQKYGGAEKNAAALTDLYTKDLLVLNPTNSSLVRGEEALRFIIDSTVIAKLSPTAYDIEGTAGYIAGYESVVENGSSRYVSNFLYGIEKGSDGKWRISSETFTLNGPQVAKAIEAKDLIAEMDAAGVKRSAVLSVAFWYGSPARKVDDEYSKVKAENDWVLDRVSQHPDRLAGFCSFNPVKDYAIEELNRCAKNPNFKGLKLHLGNSRVDVLNDDHVEKLRGVFKAANQKKIPIVVHVWRSDNYTPEHAHAFINKILPAAPDIPVQIAHMAASGPNYHADEVFEVYAKAAEKKDPRMKNVYADVAGMVTATTSDETLALVAKRLKQFGLNKVLFASDRSPGFGNEPPRDAWNSFLRLPLTQKEFRTIADNVAPWISNP